MSSLLIIYDGACPFCAAYVSLLTLRSSIDVELLSARSDDARVSHYQRLGYRLDEGILAVIGDAVYVGADAMHLLATLSESRGVMNRLQRIVFARRWLSTLLYPMLRAGRRLILWLRGLPLIEQAKEGR